MLGLLDNPSKDLARQKIVTRSLASCFAKIDLTQDVIEDRGKWRDVSLGEVADYTMNFVHQGVGRARIEKFQLAELETLYPEGRLHFNHS